MALRRAALLGLAVQLVLAESGSLRGASRTMSAGSELPDDPEWSNASGSELLQDPDWSGNSSSEFLGSVDWSDGTELLQDLDSSDNSSSELVEQTLLGAALGAETSPEAAAPSLAGGSAQLAAGASAGWWGHHHHHHHHHHHSDDHHHRRRRYHPAPPVRPGRHIMTLYHETSPAIAEKILASGFRPGHSGWCGGAIYFYGKPRVPRSKLGPDSHAGAVIEAKVDMGRTAHLDRRCHGASDARRHYDSITFNPGDGDEYLVFSNSRVLSTRRYK